MPLISWSDELSVQIASIDAQHQKLVSIINSLHDSMQLDKANAVMRRILAELASYTATHFSHEERLFKQYGYLDSASHQTSHASLVAQLHDLQTPFDAGVPISLKTFSFIKKWLTEHIMKDDRAYSQFLRSKGVT